MKNYGQFLQTYWTARGNILGFVNIKWTLVYKVRRVHVAPYGPTCTCVHIIEKKNLKKVFYQLLISINTYQAGALKFHLIKLKMLLTKKYPSVCLS